MDYRIEVLKTFNKNLTEKEKLTNAAIGTCTESAEMLDEIKKYLFHGHEFNREKIINELGDVYYYAEVLCDVLGITSDEVKARNIDKLSRRYPQGFNPQDSINRKD